MWPVPDEQSLAFFSVVGSGLRASAYLLCQKLCWLLLLFHTTFIWSMPRLVALRSLALSTQSWPAIAPELLRVPVFTLENAQPRTPCFQSESSETMLHGKSCVISYGFASPLRFAASFCCFASPLRFGSPLRFAASIRCVASPLGLTASLWHPTSPLGFCASPLPFLPCTA